MGDHNDFVGLAFHRIKKARCEAGVPAQRGEQYSTKSMDESVFGGCQENATCLNA